VSCGVKCNNMTDTTFNQQDQTVTRKTNVAGGVVHGNRITITGDGNIEVTPKN